MRRPAVCLTFDDGPHPEHTPRLLDALAAEHVKATFFVVGCRAQRYPDLVRRMVREGHDVGHHSYFHREPAATSCRSLMWEVDETVGLLRDEFGIHSTLFRPPKGVVTLPKLTGLWARGQTVVLWTVDARVRFLMAMSC